MRLDRAPHPHLRGDSRTCHKTEPMRRAVGSVEYLARSAFRLGERQSAAVHTLRAYGFAPALTQITNSPDVPPEVASRLAVPFEGKPFLRPCKVGEHETFELPAVKILKMHRLDVLRELTHMLGPMESGAERRCR